MVEPEFIRLPRPKSATSTGVCPHSGLSRTGLYNLTVPCSANNFKPAVPAKCLKTRGNVRGVWLVPYRALIDYLHTLPSSSEEIKPPTGRKAPGAKSSTRKQHAR